MTAISPRAEASSAGVDAEWREIHLRYKLAPSSFKNLLTIPKAPSRQDILRQACFCTEFFTFPFTSADKGFFREVNDHSPVPYRINEGLTQPWHKIFLLVQIDLARCGWPNKLSSAARKQLLSERGSIYRLLDQIIRCVVDILGQRMDGSGVIAALDVLRSVKAGVWEGNDMELLQVEGIGPANAKKLVHAGVKTIRQLSKLEFYHIERLLSRNPPFGQHLLHQLAGFPLLHLNAHPVKALTVQGRSAEMSTPEPDPTVIRLLLRYETDELPCWGKKTPWTTLVIAGDDGRLLWFWRGSLKRLAGRKELLVRLAARPNETVQVVFACEEIVGTLQRRTIKIDLDPGVVL